MTPSCLSRYMTIVPYFLFSHAGNSVISKPFLQHVRNMCRIILRSAQHQQSFSMTLVHTKLLDTSVPAPNIYTNQTFKTVRLHGVFKFALGNFILDDKFSICFKKDYWVHPVSPIETVVAHGAERR